MCIRDRAARLDGGRAQGLGPGLAAREARGRSAGVPVPGRVRRGGGARGAHSRSDLIASCSDLPD
eukprot:6662056-Prymnesium_polylepis.2